MTRIVAYILARRRRRAARFACQHAMAGMPSLRRYGRFRGKRSGTLPLEVSPTSPCGLSRECFTGERTGESELADGTLLGIPSSAGGWRLQESPRCVARRRFNFLELQQSEPQRAISIILCRHARSHAAVSSEVPPRSIAERYRRNNSRAHY